MVKLFADLKSSILFLSRLPLSYSAQSTLPDFTRAPRTYALAGLLIALPAALVLWVASETGLPSMIVAILSVAILIAATGALHEDGLADTVDGFWGGHDKARKLAIMRDSSIGTYGVLALILTVGLRIALLDVLISSAGSTAATIALLAAASFSRAAMLQPWSLLPAARVATETPEAEAKNGKQTSGLSIRYGSPSRSTLIWGTLATLPALALLIWVFGWTVTAIGLIAMQALILAIVMLCRRHIGGHTGDTLGATQQLSELGLLLGLVWTM